jgi:predicted RNase H-like HicB family nuclease
MKLDVRLYQDENGIWIAEVPSIPGCGSDGATREEALENVRDAIQLCMQVRADLGLPTVVETVTMDIPA